LALKRRPEQVERYRQFEQSWTQTSRGNPMGYGSAGITDLTSGATSFKTLLPGGTVGLIPKGYRTQTGVLTPDTDKKKVPLRRWQQNRGSKTYPRSKISFAPSASPTRCAGAIPTRRSTPSLRVAGFEDEDDDEDENEPPCEGAS